MKNEGPFLSPLATTAEWTTLQSSEMTSSILDPVTQIMHIKEITTIKNIISGFIYKNQIFSFFPLNMFTFLYLHHSP